MSSIDDGELYLTCSGSTEEQLTKAIIAARRAFEDAGVKPEDGFVASFMLEGAAMDGGQPSKKHLGDAEALNRARAAATAICSFGREIEAPDLGLWAHVREQLKSDHQYAARQYGPHYHIERA